MRRNKAGSPFGRTGGLALHPRTAHILSTRWIGHDTQTWTSHDIGFSTHETLHAPSFSTSQLVGNSTSVTDLAPKDYRVDTVRDPLCDMDEFHALLFSD
jgi:hypothetical protein